MATRDTKRVGKHFSVTDSSKVCSLHFKDEPFKRSFGIGRLTYVKGAVPSDLLGREAHLGRDLCLSPGLVIAIWP